MQINLSLLNMLDALIAVLLLFFFLRKIVFPPVTKAIHDRQNRIQSDLDAAESRRKEAEDLKAALEQEIKDTRARVDQTLARAVGEAEERARAIVDEAQREAKRIVTDAGLEIRREREEAMAGIRQQIVDLAILVAERVVQERMDNAKDRKLVDEFIDRIGVPQ